MTFAMVERVSSIPDISEDRHCSCACGYSPRNHVLCHIPKLTKTIRIVKVDSRNSAVNSGSYFYNGKQVFASFLKRKRSSFNAPEKLIDQRRRNELHVRLSRFRFFGNWRSISFDLEQKTGTWVKKDYKITGQWSIEQRGDQQVILFNEQFKTKKGPDLKLFLSPQSIDEVTGRTATNNAVFIAELKSSHGSQEYVLPAGIDVRNFRSLVIHCEQFSVLWGGTSL